MIPFDFEQARAYAIERLERELSPKLTYHSLWHTCHDVVVAAKRLADMENIAEHDRLLLLTGAYFHDIGFVEQLNDHETASMRIAAAVLPQFGYTPQHIATVQGLIEVTRIPQCPRNRLEEILADADLDILGREDFWIRSRALYDEIKSMNGNISHAAWCETQLHFLQAHRYFTSSARSLRQAMKEEHINELIQRAQNGCICSE
jgi:predicted metal-dependent HD superfamily phosphohydrolase